MFINPPKLTVDLVDPFNYLFGADGGLNSLNYILYCYICKLLLK